MPKVDVYDIKGKKVSDIELAENVFGIEPNENIVHAVLVNYLANQRQGTQSTKTRAEVRGGGKKPWRQKGTGRARQGSIRAPQWIKGGIALGPKPRSYKYTVNKKEKRLAIKSVLSSKVLEKELPTGDMIEVMFYNTHDDSIYLYCGIPRYMLKDNDNRPITYFHYLERKLKSYVYETNKIEDTHSQEEYIYDHFYRTYIIEALEKVLEICKDNPNIKNIRIDCNKKFNNRIDSILMELGFVLLPIDYPERINFLKDEYPEYQIPEQMDLLFQRFPDREVSYNEHVSDLDDRLELIKNMYIEEEYESDVFLENESSIVKDFNNSLMDEEII